MQEIDFEEEYNGLNGNNNNYFNPWIK